MTKKILSEEERRERRRASWRAYAARNREKNKERDKRRRSEYGKAYYEANKDTLKKKGRAWYQANKKKHLERCKSWLQRNRHKVRAKSRERYRAYEGARRLARRRQRRLGISPEQYGDLRRAQNGCCAICRKKGSLSVDHDHLTGMVRGLLCHPCNLALGCLRADARGLELLEAAIAYLKKGPVPGLLVKKSEIGEANEPNMFGENW